MYRSRQPNHINRIDGERMRQMDFPIWKKNFLFWIPFQIRDFKRRPSIITGSIHSLRCHNIAKLLKASIFMPYKNNWDFKKCCRSAAPSVWKCGTWQLVWSILHLILYLHNTFFFNWKSTKIWLDWSQLISSWFLPFICFHCIFIVFRWN